MRNSMLIPLVILLSSTNLMAGPTTAIQEAPEFKCAGTEYQFCADCMKKANDGTEKQLTSEQKKK
jgi:hypothetical protein